MPLLERQPVPEPAETYRVLISQMSRPIGNPHDGPDTGFASDFWS